MSLQTRLAALIASLGADVKALATSVAGKVSSTLLGTANGVATLGSDGKILSTQLPAAVLGQVSYQGTWNASGAAPSASPAKGQYWVVTTAGGTNLSGITDWKVGDWAIYNGAAWDKVDNTDAVAAVAGLTGSISAAALRTALSVNNTDNTADADKPVSTPQAAALAGKVDLTSPQTINGLKELQNTSGTGLVINRTNSATNSTIQYQCTGGSLYAGLRTSTTWGVGSAANLSTNSFFYASSDGVLPGTTAVQTVGTTNSRWATAFFVTTPIVGSDERIKTPLRALSEAENAAAMEIGPSIGFYQLLDSVEEKGAAARWHCGVGAQTVAAIMVRHGLDPARYGWFCYDKWEALPELWEDIPSVIDEDGNEVEPARRALAQAARAAGEQYSVRYDELAMFLMAAVFSKQS